MPPFLSYHDSDTNANVRNPHLDSLAVHRDEIHLRTSLSVSADDDVTRHS